MVPNRRKKILIPLLPPVRRSPDLTSYVGRPGLLFCCTRVIGNTFRDNRNAISLGGLRGNGATDNLIAESTIAGNENAW
eukprot:COSAG02_NODE_57437_length_280_cov_1.149171_1_plen_78_part_01